MFKCKNETISCESAQTLEQVAQRGYEILILGDIQILTRHSPGQLLGFVVKDDLNSQRPKGAQRQVGKPKLYLAADTPRPSQESDQPIKGLSQQVQRSIRTQRQAGTQIKDSEEVTPCLGLSQAFPNRTSAPVSRHEIHQDESTLDLDFCTMGHYCLGVWGTL